jgi:hypothetical protein
MAWGMGRGAWGRGLGAKGRGQGVEMEIGNWKWTWFRIRNNVPARTARCQQQVASSQLPVANCKPPVARRYKI